MYAWKYIQKKHMKDTAKIFYLVHLVNLSLKPTFSCYLHLLHYIFTLFNYEEMFSHRIL